MSRPGYSSRKAEERDEDEPERSPEQSLAAFTQSVPVRGLANPKNPELIELDTFPSAKASVLGKWIIEELGYDVRTEYLGGLKFLRVVGTGLLVYETSWRVAALKPSIEQFLTGSLNLYRGLPIWHTFYPQALGGQLRPWGTGPPDFTTAKSAYIPCADDPGVCHVAAVSRRGESNPGSVGGLDQVQDFNEDDPDQVLGIVVKAVASAAGGHSVAFFNTGEVQVKGPIACSIHKVWTQRDVDPQRFGESKQIIESKKIVDDT